jgi:glyoxylase I family protein
MTTITQFLHATLLVTDLEVSRYFYETVLGLLPAPRDLSFAGAWYQLGPVQIHLIVAERVIGDRINPEKWGRNRHLALAVTDIETMKQHLESLGQTFQLSASGRAALFIADPDGNLIELTQV